MSYLRYLCLLAYSGVQTHIMLYYIWCGVRTISLAKSVT